MKNFVALYGNVPAPLAVKLMNSLSEIPDVRSHLLYWDRGDALIKHPVREVQVHSARSRVGATPITKLVFRIWICSKLLLRLLSLRPSVVHAYNFDMLAVAGIARLLSLGSIKVVAVLQDTSEWMHLRWTQWIQYLCYKLASFTIVTSRAFATDFLLKRKIVSNADSIIYVPNAPYRNNFKTFNRHKDERRLTVGYFGTFRGIVGIRTLMEAVENSNRRGADVQLLFAGGGMLEDFVSNAARETNSIVYVGRYHHDDIMKLYEAVDVVYCIYDTSSDKKIHMACRFCESVVCGLPVVCASGTHMGEVTKSERLGFCVELGNVDELTDLLSRLAGNRTEFEKAVLASPDDKAKYCYDFYEDEVKRKFMSLVWAPHQAGEEREQRD